jgi:transcriptional regulator of acetoin/glycerol metabolism
VSALTSARREIDKAWRSFVIDRRPPQGVRPEILRSWQRAGAEWHIDPGLRRCLRSVEANDLLARAEAEEAFRVASPLLREFANRLAPDGHALAYCDADGVTLALQGNGRTIERLADINLGPGACWSEDATGTNGIGTALVEGRPVEVFASEHFVEAWQPWSCASAPVQAAGGVVGVVDITSPWEAHNASLLVCAEALARAIEARLDEAAAHRAEIIRRALREKGGSSAWLAVDLHGNIVGTGPASTLGGCDPGSVRDSALAPLLAQLRRARPSGEFEQVLHVAGRPLRIACSSVEQEGRTVGGVLRVAVARPARARPTPSAARRRMYSFDDILGSSPALERQVALARSAARTPLPVLILGESGTGKELFAQAIHSASERAEGPFIALNCGAIPESLLEAELFGYEPGSFTGARKAGQHGKFEDAAGGTLFLDEVGELSPLGQTALLRMLQEHEVTRIGSSTTKLVDVRVIAASNRVLHEEVQAGRFREDLYYRLDVLSVELPPLRSRKEDLPRLADHYLTQAQIRTRRCGLTLSSEALAALVAYDWPGNVRELKNVLERAVVTAPGPEILVSDLPGDVQAGVLGAHGGEGASRAPQAAATVAVPAAERGAAPPDPERAALERALELSTWNVVRAARALGLSRRTMYRRLKKHHLTRG